MFCCNNFDVVIHDIICTNNQTRYSGLLCFVAHIQNLHMAMQGICNVMVEQWYNHLMEMLNALYNMVIMHLGLLMQAS